MATLWYFPVSYTHILKFSLSTSTFREEEKSQKSTFDLSFQDGGSKRWRPFFSTVLGWALAFELFVGFLVFTGNCQWATRFPSTFIFQCCCTSHKADAQKQERTLSLYLSWFLFPIAAKLVE